MTEPVTEPDPAAVERLADERNVPLTTDPDQQDGALGGGGGEEGSG